MIPSARAGQAIRDANTINNEALMVRHAREERAESGLW
jgi:hypothetical protein